MMRRKAQMVLAYLRDISSQRALFRHNYEQVKTKNNQ